MELSGVKNLLKKAVAKEPERVEPEAAPSFSVFYNYENYDAIYDLLRELMNDGKLSDLRNTVYLNCKLIDEKTRLCVYAAKPGRGNTYRCIGTVYNDDVGLVLQNDKLVRSKKYYWSLSMYYNYVTGTKFVGTLRESKFSK